MVDNYYNEEIFKHSIDFIIDNFYQSAFKFFQELANFYEAKDYHKVKHNRRKIYDILLEFYQAKGFIKLDIFNEVIRLDFIENNKGLKLPDRVARLKLDISKMDIHKILKDEQVLDGVFKEVKDQATRELLKQVQIEKYPIDVLKLIEDGNIIREDKYLMTVYLEGILNKAKTIDITSIVAGLDK